MSVIGRGTSSRTELFVGLPYTYLVSHTVCQTGVYIENVPLAEVIGVVGVQGCRHRVTHRIGVRR